MFTLNTRPFFRAFYSDRPCHLHVEHATGWPSPALLVPYGIHNRASLPTARAFKAVAFFFFVNVEFLLSYLVLTSWEQLCKQAQARVYPYKINIQYVLLCSNRSCTYFLPFFFSLLLFLTCRVLRILVNDYFLHTSLLHVSLLEMAYVQCKVFWHVMWPSQGDTPFKLCISLNQYVEMFFITESTELPESKRQNMHEFRLLSR